MFRYIGAAVLLLAIGLIGKFHYNVNQKEKEWLSLAESIQVSCTENTVCPESILELNGSDAYEYNLVEAGEFELYYYVGPDWWFHAIGGASKSLEAWVQIDDKKTARKISE